MDVTIDEYGRIVIPKPVREALGLEAGATLHLETIEGDSGTRKIALRPEQEESPYRKKGDGDVRVYTGRLVDDDIDVVQLIKEQRETRARHLAGFE